jgi:hypothetical protein
MDFDLSGADASFWGEDADDWSGRSVASAGDVNGDGRDDFLIGAHFNDDGGDSAGQTYLLLGTPLLVPPPFAPCDYDTPATGGNGNGVIDIAEVLKAIADYFDGLIDIALVLDTIPHYFGQIQC